MIYELPADTGIEHNLLSQHEAPYMVVALKKT